jgi:glycosyltransferase involved in cell wall biosynthesis
VNTIDPSLGGNFSYHEKFISALDASAFEKVEICFVGRLPKNKIKTAKTYTKLASPFLYQIFNGLNKLKIPSFLKRIIGVNIDLCSKVDNRILRDRNIDLVLYPNQFVKGVTNYPFITMNWDAGHKTTFAFPEVLEDFQNRENWYRVEIQKALGIFVESQSSKQEFATYFSIPEEKLYVIPLFAGSVVNMKVETIRQREILSAFDLQPLKYFYYPAQFWAHKNHFNLLRGFKIFLERNPASGVRMVFSGSDKGNKAYIKYVISELALDSHVTILNFISNEEVFSLYKNAIALTMGTFLGPTNMPLLEAQALGTAVICSDLEGHRELCGDGAIYVDPKNHVLWADSFEALLEADFRDDLIKKGNSVLTSSSFNIENAIKEVERSLTDIIAIRKTFH